MKTLFLGAVCLMLTGAAALRLPGTAVQARQPGPQDLAIQAREVLRRHCFECHGRDRQTKADLRILDHPTLVDPARKLVIPRVPDRSRLLELIEDGSMPQGTRPKVSEAERQVLGDWVRAGAPPFVHAHSEAYVRARILDDIRQLGPKDRPRVRYLSLHHLLAEAESRADLEVQRAALRQFVGLLARPAQPGLVAVEPTQTVFRIDLRALGWDEPLLTAGQGRDPLLPAQLNRFDLMLLEYPYGVLPGTAEDYAALGREFLGPARQVRPLAYVRGDWLVHLAASRGGKPAGPEPALERARQLYEAPLDLTAARAELDWPRSSAELQGMFAARGFEKLGLAPLAGGGTVRRDTWEKAYAPAVRQLNLGVPVIPLDSLSRPDYASEPPPFTVDVSAQDPGTRQKKDRFSPGDPMVIVVEASQDVIIELIWATAKGKKFILNLGSRRVKAGKAAVFGPAKEGHYTISKEPGRDQIVLFAYEAGQLAAENDFPAGQVFQGKDTPDRVVHPFYLGWPDGKAFDAARLVKKTIDIEIHARP